MPASLGDSAVEYELAVKAIEKGLPGSEYAG